MFTKLKQFKDIRSKAKVIQDALSHESVEGSAGWGKVKVKMDGNQKVTDVQIDPSLLTDAKTLATSVKDAVNDAVTKVQRVMASKMKDLGGNDLARDVQEMMKK
ncbi:nucleoid-associated protein, YbaB/EbfC family [Candidatus Uhrbacteria bacterium RIFCSPHIGHO2_12_FULL_60_25]|uniref:Nucleoid-associated protein A3E39_03565 n=1 Tax=Candidatus Uhrbacteria bacterium RIFCSPHIGHO2_12_FULL_60_25 TaxID=1802399 RepID=A0A1F7UKS3_9BACT|nr:MAG: nucleoid-associated protein, YbaB/EbfC family [Candidatus Uhrbacteria bacterium RIFCSPHIGHO2_02_FULL_60_44]OGL78881.1 MAG: nucleoid-associated protein, YbaB/EbfC family [Candidatus Uhrbacteria bacterium RIFCSPHIGHO2_12_FULL_60_25]